MIRKRYLSPTECAEYFGVCSKTVLRQIRAGKIPAIKFGGQWRIDLQAMLNGTSQVPNTADLSAETLANSHEISDEKCSKVETVNKKVTPGRSPKWMESLQQ